MDLSLQKRDKVMSSRNASNEETPQNLTPKFVEELVEEVLGNNRTIEMFQAMEIISLKIGNLGLEIQPLINQVNHNGRGKARIDAIDEVGAIRIRRI
jgi:predicted house-cleaning noncanonical NTP pyrophosphatase (MazG superfamily)